jgi:hypothetical protein
VALQVTEAGLRTIGVQAGADGATETAAVGNAEQVNNAGIGGDFGTREPGTTPQAAPTGAITADASSPRASLRGAVQRLLATWDDETGERAGLAEAMVALRAVLVKPAPAALSAGPCKPRESTKQEAVLALLRRPEGASGPQLIEATGWALHTVRGFLAGLARKGIAVTLVECIRQVGPSRAGAKGSYSIYRIAEVG